MLTRFISFTFFTVSFAMGCSSSVAGARPQDTSQAEHQSAAAEHAQAGHEHAAQYDEKAMTDPGDCIQYLGSCWGSNPTDSHKDEAAEHQRAAAAHRAAAASLSSAEARACQGVSEADRDISPFFHREAIAEVKPLSQQVFAGQGTVEKDAGATVVLLPAPGVTAERLQRVIECHLARNAALGHDVPEMAYCPLVLKGVTATVTSAGNGFAVNIAATDPATIAEVLRRARALVPR